MQDVYVGMSVSGASRATCARSLCESFLWKMSVSETPQQNPVGALVQERCMRISCARCLCQDLLSKTTCARSLYADLLRKSSVSGSLHQGPVYRTSCARSLYDEDLLRKVFKLSSEESCRSTCARSVYEDLLRKMSVSRSPKPRIL